MLLPLLLLLLLPALAASAGCASAADCCYSGTCDLANGACACDRGFGGGSCCTFEFQPAPSKLIAKLPRETGLHDDYAWGGSVIQAEGGEYHMFKSVLLNSCPINYYDTNSIIVHMTAPEAGSGMCVWSGVEGWGSRLGIHGRNPLCMRSLTS